MNGEVDPTHVPPPPAELLREEFARVAAQDVEGIMAMVDDRIVGEVLPLGHTVRGTRQLRRFFESLFTAVDDLGFETVAVHGTGEETAVGEWRLTGRFSGGAFHGLVPTGKPIDLRGVDIMRWRDGRLIHDTAYFDGLTLARQIGVFPRRDSVGDRTLTAALNLMTRARARTRLDMPHYR